VRRPTATRATVVTVTHGENEGAASRTFVVGAGDTAAAVGSGALDVLGTPTLLAWMEAATLAADPLPATSASLGVSVSVEHVAACRVGAQVLVDARITERNGRRTTFAVVAHDSGGRLLGSASITRVAVEVERFMHRVPE
jgi:fluoroacetyl-CoA thioesterase